MAKSRPERITLLEIRAQNTRAARVDLRSKERRELCYAGFHI